MCYTVIPTPKFEKDLDYYERKKKFTKIYDDVDEVVRELEKGNLIVNVIKNLKYDTEEHTYKVRMANSNTKVGQSNGYRIIYYVVKDDKEIYLLTVYYKKDDKNIPNNFEIVQLINEYCLS